MAPVLSLLAALAVGGAGPGIASGLANPEGALYMAILGPGFLLLAGLGGLILWMVSRWMPRTVWTIAALVVGYLGIYTLVAGANPTYDAGLAGVLAGWLDILLALGAVFALLRVATGKKVAGSDRAGLNTPRPVDLESWNASIDTDPATAKAKDAKGPDR